MITLHSWKLIFKIPILNVEIQQLIPKHKKFTDWTVFWTLENLFQKLLFFDLYCYSIGTLKFMWLLILIETLSSFLTRSYLIVNFQEVWCFRAPFRINYWHSDNYEDLKESQFFSKVAIPHRPNLVFYFLTFTSHYS